MFKCWLWVWSIHFNSFQFCGVLMWLLSFKDKWDQPSLSACSNKQMLNCKESFWFWSCKTKFSPVKVLRNNPCGRQLFHLKFKPCMYIALKCMKETNSYSLPGPNDFIFTTLRRPRAAQKRENKRSPQRKSKDWVAPQGILCTKSTGGS